MCTEPTEKEYKPLAGAKTGRPGQSNEMSLKTDVTTSSIKITAVRGRIVPLFYRERKQTAG